MVIYILAGEIGSVSFCDLLHVSKSRKQRLMRKMSFVSCNWPNTYFTVCAVLNLVVLSEIQLQQRPYDIHYSGTKNDAPTNLVY